MAWQPFTPKGIAAFAQASVGRLLAVQLLMAFVAASTIAWFVQTAWCPIIASAIAQLPDRGEIRRGQLDWPGPPNQTLAENRFLALTVDLEHAGQARSPAHVQFELGKRDVQIRSLLGFARLPYWRHWTVPCNRVGLAPWWGAWRPPLVALLFAGVTVLLLLNWALLASVYFLPAWLVGLFSNRALGLLDSWRLSGAALIPGAALMSAAIVCYRWGMLELVGLMVAAALHIVVGLGYLLTAVLCLERHPASTPSQGNPFIAATNGPAGTPMTDPQPKPPKPT